MGSRHSRALTHGVKRVSGSGLPPKNPEIHQPRGPAQREGRGGQGRGWPQAAPGGRLGPTRTPVPRSRDKGAPLGTGHPAAAVTHHRQRVTSGAAAPHPVTAVPQGPRWAAGVGVGVGELEGDVRAPGNLPGGSSGDHRGQSWGRQAGARAPPCGQRRHLGGSRPRSPGQRGARRPSCLELSAGGSRSTGSFPSGHRARAPTAATRKTQTNNSRDQGRGRPDGGGVEIKGPQSFTYLFLRISGYWHVDSESTSLAGPTRLLLLPVCPQPRERGGGAGAGDSPR